jgi:hypothetical protein
VRSFSSVAAAWLPPPARFLCPSEVGEFTFWEERGGHRARLQSRGVPGCRGVPPWGSATGGRLLRQALARMRDGPVEGLLFQSKL